MDFIDHFVIPPSSEGHLQLLKYILIVIFTIHFSYMGMLLGNSFYSVFANISQKRKANPVYFRLSEDLMNTALMNKPLLIILGILPPVCIALIYFQILYKSDFLTGPLLLYSTFLAGLSIAILYLYKITFSVREKRFYIHIFAGLSGVCILFMYYFVFFEATGFLLGAKTWAALEEPFKVIFSSSVLIRFFYFIALSFALAGSSILFFCFHWNGGLKNIDEDYRKFLEKLSVKFTGVFLIIQFVLLIFYLMMLPQEAKSGDVAGPVALIFLLSYGIGIMLIKMDLKFETAVLIGFILIVFSAGAVDFYNREAAIEGHTEFLVSMANKAKEKRTGKTVEVSVSGEEVYKGKCSSCHHYDMDLTGPPFSKVLPKYKDNLEGLKAFIKNPVKVDANYGAMPKIGLKEKELQAVSEYLLTGYWKEKTGETLIPEPKDETPEETPSGGH